MKKNGCKASKGVQERTAANDDELVDIWWLYILIKFSIINWLLPELSGFVTIIIVTTIHIVKKDWYR
jgi:hypothetical protein